MVRFTFSGYSFLFFLLLSSQGLGQSMALAYKGGFIYPDHRLAGLTTYTDSWEIHYRLEAEQTSWLDLFSVPDVGLALKITDFNHPQVGIGINPMGYFNFRLLGKHVLSVNGTLGTGLSFFTESYSATKSLNKAIGYPVTFAVRMSGYMEYRRSP